MQSGSRISNLAYYFLVYGNNSSINTSMITASVNSSTLNSNSINDDTTATVETSFNVYDVNYLNTDAFSMIHKSMEYCTSKYKTIVHTIYALIIAFYTHNFQYMNDHV